jgi:hypothetical protein
MGEGIQSRTDPLATGLILRYPRRGLLASGVRATAASLPGKVRRFLGKVHAAADLWSDLKPYS